MGHEDTEVTRKQQQKSLQVALWSAEAKNLERTRFAPNT